MIMKLLSLAYIVMWLVGSWQLHDKAGQPGWVGIVPFLNTLGRLKMIGKPYWWALLYLIPVVNILVHLIVMVNVARSFGKSGLFGLVMAIPFFTPFCVASIGLGEARYLGPNRV